MWKARNLLRELCSFGFDYVDFLFDDDCVIFMGCYVTCKEIY